MLQLLHDSDNFVKPSKQHKRRGSKFISKVECNFVSLYEK